MNRFSPTFFPLAAGFLLVSGAPAASFTPLGHLPGGGNSSASGVSADGSVVVGDSHSASGGAMEILS